MDLHDVAREVARTAGADFAFVLSQAGLLVTHDAPRDMPDRGRMKILWACPAGKNGELAHLEMPREDLVPYGGAAPIDVYAVRVEDTAILVAAVASWNDKSNVVLAVTTGAAALGEMIRKAKRARAQRIGAKRMDAARKEKAAVASGGGRRERASAVPPETPRRERTTVAPPESGRRERTSALPGSPRRERTSALPKAPKEGTAAKRAARPRSSEPEISLGEAEVGRETMIAIDATRPRSEPEISLGEAEVGRETMIAIEAVLPRAAPGPAPEAMRVQLDSMGRDTMVEIERLEASQQARVPTVEEPFVRPERRTLPWVDSPAALKRTVEARAAARAVAAPEVKVTVEEMDPEALERALREDERR